MRYTGLKYILDSLGIENNQIKASFDFQENINPSLTVLPNFWSNSSVSGILNNINNFYDFPGTGFFDGNTLMELNQSLELNDNSTFLFSFEKLRQKDEILISSIGGNSINNYSGFFIGVNDANKLYFKYWNSIEGPFTFTYNNILADKNLVFINKNNSTVTIGKFNNNTFNFDIESFEIKNNFFLDNSKIFLGGKTGNYPWVFGSNFSGYIDNFYFFRDVSNFYLNNLAQGLFSNINVLLSTITNCYNEIVWKESGYFYSGITGVRINETVTQELAITGYELITTGYCYNTITGYQNVVIGTEIDCGIIRDIIFKQPIFAEVCDFYQIGVPVSGYINITGYTQEILSGLISGSTGFFTTEEICNEFVSGETVQYILNNNYLSNLSFSEISFLKTIDKTKNDIIEIYIEKYQPIELFYNRNLLYNRVDLNFILDQTTYTDFLLFSNGQVLLNNNYNLLTSGYDTFIIPNTDYILTGDKIETNRFFDEKDYLFYDYFEGNTLQFKNTGDLINLPDSINNNYWIFRNGQKLIKDKDYSLDSSNNFFEFKQKLTGSNGGSVYGSATAINYDGSIFVMGGPYDNISGAIIIFTGNSLNEWKFKQKIISDNNNAFGLSVSIDKNGSTLLVGAPYDNLGGSNAGLVYVYTGNKFNGWSLKQKITGGAPMQFFGTSVSVNENGEILMIGAFNDNTAGSNAGAALIYTGNASLGWQLKQKLTGSNFGSYGTSVAMNNDGTILTMGGPYDNTAGADAGAALIYTGNASLGWQLKQKLTGSSLGGFGVSVAMNNDGTILTMGGDGDAVTQTVPGLVNIYAGNSNNGWGLQQTITGGNTNSLGSRIALSKQPTILLIGVYGDDTAGIDAGAALIYKKSLSDIILNDITPNEENYIIIKEIPNNFIYESGSFGSLKLNDSFNNGCSQVYYNGVKQKINNNYIENSNLDLISGDFYENDNIYIIYNNTEDFFV
jgi:hypothetical protein